MGDSPVSASPVLTLQVCATPCLALYVVSGEQNSGPYCSADTLPTEPFPETIFLPVIPGELSELGTGPMGFPVL